MGGTCSKDDSAAGHHDGALHNNPYNASQHQHQQQQQQQQQQQPSNNNNTKPPNCWTSCAGMDTAVDPRMDSCRADAIDPVMYDLCRKSLGMTLQDEEALRRQQQQQQQQQQESAPVQQQPQQQAPSQSQSQSQANSTRTKKQPLQQPKQHKQLFVGQFHLLYKHQSKTGSGAADGTTTTSDAASTAPTAVVENDISTVPTTSPYSTRLIVRRRPIAAAEEGTHGTHLYAIRYPPDEVVDHKKVVAGPNGDSSRLHPEQCPTSSRSFSTTTSSSGQREKKKRSSTNNSLLDPAAEPIPEPLKPSPALPTEMLTDFFQPAKTKPAASTSTAKHSKQTIQEWVTVSEEHCIYVVDVGLSPAQCDKIVQVTEQVCRGQYAAYTYAKQTLGCREFPILAQACAPPVQAVVHAILALPSNTKSSSSKAIMTKTTTPGGNDATTTTTTTSSSSSQPVQNLQLDDREPHLVKYDVTKKERQKLDMHTDKSEWTFLIALSNGCGLDYDGGGTYFECLNATIHVQRGHALIFPGKLRHCGQRITRGLRYLLVGFLVDKVNMVSSNTNNNTANSTNANASNSASNNSTTANNSTGTAAVKDPKDDDNNNSNKNDSNVTVSSGTSPVSAKTLTSGSPSTLSTITNTIYT